MKGNNRFTVTNGMRIVGLLLIGGGAYGAFLTIRGYADLLTTSQVTVFSVTTAFAGVIVLVFGWCVWTGVDLWRGRRQALKFAMVLFAMQIPVVTVPGFSYHMHTALQLRIGFLSGGDVSVGFKLGAALNLDISSDVQGLAIGVNLVALFVLIYLIRVARELAQETRAAAAGLGG